MIKTLKLSNFRSLGAKVELQLDRLNFLVGSNGAGKSNVLHALSFVRDALRIGLPGAVPGAIPLLYDYLKEASTRSQVLVTTHSPIFLDFMKREDCRVFAVGRGGGGTEVRALTEVQRKSVQDKLMSLGDLMLAGELQFELPIESDE